MLVLIYLQNKLLEKKCHRRDITALASDLPPKNEFVIKIPLTNVQKELYNWYLSRKHSDNHVRILGALKRLQMISNHPAILIRQLRAVKNTLKGLSEVIDEVEDEEDDVDIGEDGKIVVASKKMAEDALEFLKTVTPEGFDLEALENSHRMVLLMEILKKSQKMGDKVLVFSHQISTISYVKEQLDKHKISNSVLTGIYYFLQSMAELTLPRRQYDNELTAKRY
jgi:SNF2 family DNA or RNA helicase